MKTDTKEAESIDSHIAGFPPETREKLEALRHAIRSVAPDAREAIKYGIPTFILHENLVHFAGYARHIGFYPGSSGIERFKDELAPYKMAKGSVRFPIDQPVPLDLVKRIAAFRVEEAMARAAAKKR